MIGSLFSGIGGLELGLERATGMNVAWQVEIDPWCRKVLAKHWPTAKQFEDVKTVGDSNLDPVELICGGFPCQDVSGAGKRVGLSGERSGLWFEFKRIIREMRPRFVVVENVASGAKRWVPTVRSGLEELGYRTRAYSISAFDVGAPHRRKRVFIIANTNSVLVREPKQRAQVRRNAKPSNNGETRPIADTNGVRELQQSGSVPNFWRWSRDSGGWTIEPTVCGVDNGLRRGLDKGRRLKALGNAVVPQCAEVIGNILMEAGNA